MRDNPFEPPITDRQPTMSMSLVPLVVLIWGAVVATGVYLWEANGLLLLVFIAVHWCLLSDCKSPRWSPLNSRQMTLTEFAVVIAIILIIWGLLLPPVKMVGRPRLPLPAPSPAAASAEQTVEIQSSAAQAADVQDAAGIQ